MEELAVHEFSKVLPLFEKIRIYRAMPLSVIGGKQRGRIFVDQRIEPKTALIHNVAGVDHVVGSANNASFNQSLSQVLLEELDHEMGLCVLIPGSKAWDLILADTSDDQIRKRDHSEVSFTFDASRFSPHTDWETRIPSDFTMRPITVDWVEELGSHYQVFQTWQSPESFISNGFGFCLIHGTELASVAYSHSGVTNEGYVELGVRTVEKYWKQGLATLTCSAFIEHSLDQGLEPDWHTYSMNLGSIALAKKLGYEPDKEFPTYLVVARSS